MKKLLIVATLCASSALAYAEAPVAQPTLPELGQAPHPALAQALPLSNMNALAIHSNPPPPGFPHFGEQPILTKVTGHTNVVVGDQTVALSTSEQRYAGGYVSECKQYVKSFEHQIVAESSIWNTVDVPTDETTIKLGNHCDRPTKG